MADSKIKVLVHSNHSRAVTGFGKNMKNLMFAFYNDPDIELIEAANGIHIGSDLRTPWKSYGTLPSNQKIINEIAGDALKQRMASYGYYTIDEIIEDCKPDIYLGVEDIWAFQEFEKKPWWSKIKTIIWTTLDSVPILQETFTIAPSCDKFIVWASFAEKEIKKNGFENVSTLHGAVDYSNFKPLENREEIRTKFNINEDFVIGFVFKNQLRKSAPNLLEGFKIFKQENPEVKTKLLLHTDWSEIEHGWDIIRYINEKKIQPEDILASYICHKCGQYYLHQYIGEGKDCLACGTASSVKTKTSALGVSEKQLNEIYNCMDVYCHPFTSGGQELPIQEAKASGLVTLVTEYSCGTDSCYEDQGGIPLKWNEYREPYTQFIKATTCPLDIAKQLKIVYEMGLEEKTKLLENGKKTIQEQFSVQIVTAKLKEIFKELKNTPITDVEENIEDSKKTEANNSAIKIADILDGSPEDRILFVMPESAEDVFLSTSLLPLMKEAYPNKDIYFATKKEYQDILIGNPHIYKTIDYSPEMENLILMEGHSNHKGFFEICFLPHIGTQKMFDYIHQGNKDNILLNIHSKNHNKHYALN